MRAALQTMKRSPPPTRGSTPIGAPFAHDDPVSPAHAGIDLFSWGPDEQVGRLPRPRGDRPQSHPLLGLTGRSPPPTRGSTAPVLAHHRLEPVSPAHAGIDRRGRGDRRRRRCLPRPRGDRPSPASTPTPRAPSPPPTRGSTAGALLRLARALVSPAHAGIDRIHRWRLRYPGRLPRPRGDRPLPTYRKTTLLRSPPPTRGSTV